MNFQTTTESSESLRKQLEMLELENELYRRAQLVLESDREASELVFENAPVGLFVLDRDGSIHRVNKRGAIAFGVASHELIHEHFQRFVCEPSAALFADHLALANGPCHSATSDLLLCRESGDSFWARTRSELSESADHRGSSIIVTIDEIDDLILDMRAHVEVDSHQNPFESTESECAGGRILLVDDDELIVKSVSRVLSRLGFEIASYTDPMEALAAFTSSPDAFDAVISDFQMPKLNGLDLCEQIAQVRGDIPILLTSAFIGEIDQVRAKEVGVECVMPKPLSTHELKFWLNDVMTGLPGHS